MRALHNEQGHSMGKDHVKRCGVTSKTTPGYRQLLCGVVCNVWCW